MYSTNLHKMRNIVAWKIQSVVKKLSSILAIGWLFVKGGKAPSMTVSIVKGCATTLQGSRHCL